MDRDVFIDVRLIILTFLLDKIAPVAALAMLGMAGVAVAAPVTSPAFPGVVCETVMVPMRDGTLLATDRYSPVNSGQYPVILLRDPYTRSFGGGCFQGIGGGALGPASSLAVFAQNGYVALAQEVRGTNRSQGAFREMVQEAQDGYDAIEWAGTQPWSTGKVGTTSGSYLGLTQWQPAIHAPPHLAAIAPQITASDYHDNWTYVNGVFDLWFGMSWPPGFVSDQLIRALQATGAAQSEIDARVAAWNANVSANLATTWVWELPLTGFDKFYALAPYYYDWLDHPTYDSFWRALDVENRWEKVKVPALMNSAWYDIFQVGSFRNFAGMKAGGGSESARRGTKLIVGAYGHAGDSGAPTFGNDGGLSLLLPVQAQLRFFDRYLKGAHNGYENDPDVQLYVLVPPDTGNGGSGFWVTGDTYPLPGTRVTTLFLASGGHANSSKGDGRLVAEQPRHAGSYQDQFDYDPRNPVPTVGGNMCCNGVLLLAGARDQTAVELRDDVLVYTSAPLDRDLAVIGPVEVKIWARSSSQDTDFTAKLVDIHLDGVSHNVLDRIVRARFRNGSKLPPSFIEPGKAYEYEILLGNAGTVFRKGHRIRLEISSSSFPHYARNLNTGLSNEWTSETEVARQTILHDEHHPSQLLLPVAAHVTVPK